jgi:hypothetical protein
MAENVIYTRKSRAEVRRIINQIPRIVSGKGQGNPAAKAILVRVGLEALGRIRQAFIVKAGGGTDEAGDSWAPLKPATIAYSRRHPGLPPPKVRAKFRPSYALKKEERKAWWTAYGRVLAWSKDKGLAAALAWKRLKAAGANTLLGLYGNTKVQILRDTGLLLNSLSPGVQNKGVFRVGRGEVIIGTNRKWAGVHHRGSKKRGIPQRRLWPNPKRWPSKWWKGMLRQAKDGVINVVISLFK